MIDAQDRFERHRLEIHDSHMAFVDEGAGPPIVFLHGNPTSSYLWRNVIAALRPDYRCLAPDLIGMGDSGKPTGCRYHFSDHIDYLDAWFDQVAPTLHLVVGHGWGATLVFHRARTHAAMLRGLAYCEPVVGERDWSDFPDSRRSFFESLRGPEGDRMVFEENIFVEAIPRSVQRALTAEEMARYRAPFAATGPGRLPTLSFPRQLPISGEPADVVAVTTADAAFMATSDLPKLLLLVSGATGLTERQRAQCRAWPNQREVMLDGYHFVQEDSPQEMAAAIAEFAAEIFGSSDHLTNP